MANTTGAGVGNQQLYNDNVLKGFVASLAPLMVFTWDVSPAPAEKGQAVNVVFIPSGSTPQAWAEGTGYSIQTATRVARQVTLSNHYFVSTGLTDIEIANSSLMKIEDTAFNQGASLGNYVFASIAATITGSNFNGNDKWFNVATASAYATADLVKVRKQASNLNWGANRNIVVTPQAYYGLLNDTRMLWTNRGDTDAVKQGVLRDVYGWNNVFESTGLPTQVSSSNNQIGFAATPDACLCAMRYLMPGDEGGKQLIEAYPLVDERSGIVLGYRKWYDPNLGQVKSVYEAVWGSTLGNSQAAIILTATDITS